MAVELATAYVSLVASAKGIQQSIAGELGEPTAKAAEDSGKEAGKRFQGGMSGAMKGLALIGGVGAVVGGLSAATSAASDLQETVSKSNTIFGPAAADIEKWASGAAKGFGQSKQQAIDAAATFGNLFVQLGVGSDQAAGMSKSMVELASDFASFHNANPAEVIEAQTAAFRGEYDALQRFVPTINAAAVEQKALAMTGKATTKELTLQEKALATQALMMEGAGDAAGDFARTSDGLANQQRIQSAQWADLTAKIGGAFLPIMTAVTGFLVDKVIPNLGTIGAVLGAVAVGIMAALVPAFIAWAAAAIPAAIATVIATAPVILLGAAVAAAAYLIIRNWDSIKDAFTAAKDWIVDRWNDLIGFVTGIPSRIAAAASGMWDGISNAFKGAINTIIRFWNRLEFKIPGFKVGPIGYDGFTLGVPNIPEMHEGGVVSPSSAGWFPFLARDERLRVLQVGERVTAATDVRHDSGDGSMADLLAEVRALRAEVRRQTNRTVTTAMTR